MTLPEGHQDPQLPKAQDALQVASIFTVAGPDRSSRVEIIQCFCLQERGFVSGSGELCYSLGLLRCC